MEHIIIPSWKSHLEATVDLHHLTMLIPSHKAKLLEWGLQKGGYYLLTLEAGFDMEIVKVISAFNGKLTVLRGQQGTLPTIWPAGTPIEARITAKARDDLRLDLNSLISVNGEALVAPNGDVITKPA